MRPSTPWSLASLRMLKLRRARPRVAAMAAMPKAIGSAPIVSPPMAVASGGMTSSAASATRTMPSGRHAVCLVSRNQVLLPPDFRVKSPRFTEWVSTWSRRAARSIDGGPYCAAMDLRIFTEPQQGASYDDLLAVAQEAERLGFDAFFRSDHYLKMGGVAACPARPIRGSRSPAWPARRRTSGSARSSRRRPSASPARSPISVAQVDQMSGGRVELGIGAGWYEAEHAAYAIPFPPLGERFDRLEEQLTIITGLWGTPDGGTYRVRRALLPGDRLAGAAEAGAAARPPIIIGGGGPKRTPAAGRPVRGRVQPALRAARGLHDRSPSGCAPPARPSTATRPRCCSRRPSCCACGEDEAEVRAARRRHRPPARRAPRQRRRRHPWRWSPRLRRWGEAGADAHLPPGARPVTTSTTWRCGRGGRAPSR